MYGPPPPVADDVTFITIAPVPGLYEVTLPIIYSVEGADVLTTFIDCPAVQARPVPTVNDLEPFAGEFDVVEEVAYLSPFIPEKPEVPEVPEYPENPETPEKPEVPVPEVPENPEVPVPENPDIPESPEKPETPENPDFPE